MRPLTVPLCAFCRYYREDFTCEAYPGGIPDAITFSLVDHRDPQPGDDGIQFMPDESKPPMTLDPVGFVEGLLERAGITVEEALADVKANEYPAQAKGVTKGDFEGHPFRGNQWTDGAAGAGEDDDNEFDAKNAEEQAALKADEELSTRVNDVEEAHVQATIRNNDKVASSLHDLKGKQHDMTAEEFAKATREVRAIYEQKVGELAKMNVSVGASGLSVYDLDGRIVAAQAVADLHSALLAAPEATREFLNKDAVGLTVNIRPASEADAFEAGGQKFTAGGFAHGRGSSSGGFAITLITHERGMAMEDKTTQLVPGRIGSSLIDHEIGHVSDFVQERVADIKFGRADEPVAGGGGRVYDPDSSLGRQWDHLSTAREIMRDTETAYRQGAAALTDMVKEMSAKGSPQADIDAVASTATLYRQLADEEKERIELLRPAVAELYKASERESKWRGQEQKARQELSRAVNIEGAVTPYSQAWHDDPVRGKPGASGGVYADHSGVRETIAEIEADYAQQQRMDAMLLSKKTRTSPDEFAKQVIERGGREIEKGHEKVMKAWAKWRKLADKSVILRKETRISKDTKARIESALARTGGKSDYQEWQKRLDRIKADIDSQYKYHTDHHL